MRNKLFKKSINLKQVSRWNDVASHQIMIQDRVRTLAYKKAIEKNVKNNNIVLDIGCGTGILSFFAVKKGCKKVYAVDKSDIIDSAKEIAKLNKLEDRIEFTKEDILKFKPREKIDVLIHDQIGSFIWNEDIISKVAYIRDNFLKKDSTIIPYKIDLYLVPTDYRSDLEKSMFFWSRKKYGMNFSSLGTKLFMQKIGKAIYPSIIKFRDAKTFLCTEKLVYTIDLRKEVKIPRKIVTSFRLEKNSRLRGMCMFFKVYLDENNIFSTRPKKLDTHWGQIFLPCFKEKVIRQSSSLNFVLFPKKELKKWKFKFEIAS